MLIELLKRRSLVEFNIVWIVNHLDVISIFILMKGYWCFSMYVRMVWTGNDIGIFVRLVYICMGVIAVVEGVYRC